MFYITNCSYLYRRYKCYAYSFIFNPFDKIFVMKTLVVNKKVLTLYDSIDELPIVNFQKYNKYLLIDAGIGSDVDSIDEHISRLAKYIKTDLAKASQELQNYRQNLYMIASGISPKHMAFAALIHSIDGKKVEDLSDENLQSILTDLRTVRRSWLVDLLIKLKKKITLELELYFPQEFLSSREKEVYDKLKRRTQLVLERILEDKNNAEDVRKIDDYFFSLYKPNSFSGEESAEIKYDKQFESLCVLIAQKTSLNAKDMTVLQFYSALDNIKKQAEAEQKAVNKYKHKNSK